MPRPTLPQNGANARVGMAESSWMTGCRPFVGYGSGPGRAAVENYKEMKDLSKDSVNRLVVGEDGDGQRIDNFLQKFVDALRSEEHTSELQSHSDLVCRLLLEKKNTTHNCRLVHGFLLRIYTFTQTN